MTSSHDVTIIQKDATHAKIICEPGILAELSEQIFMLD
jgi:hypothetical protein